MNASERSEVANDNLTAALRLATAGVRVFPVTPGGKTPIGRLVPNGFKDATTDEAKIRDWWRVVPIANIGVPTGATTVVDLDVKNEADGIAEWETLTGSCHVPETRSVRTPSGGRHLYFSVPDGVTVRNSTSKLAGGIDIRGEGGYVLVPPSSTRVGRYTYESEAHVAEAPEWLLERIADSKTREQDPAGPIEDAIPEGKRNDTLTSLAGSMRRRGMQEVEIHASLKTVNSNRCAPPLSTEEVRSIAASVAKYAPGEVDMRRTDSKGGESGETQAERLLQMTGDIDLFRTPEGRAFATFEQSGTWQTAALSSSAFADLLRQRFYAAEGRPPSSQSLQDAKDMLRARARFDSTTRKAHLRAASHQGNIYIDLCNDKWEAVEIDARGWRVISSGEMPVRFRRTAGMAALPHPKRDGSLTLLKRHVPFQDEEAFALLCGFLVQAFRPTGPYPLLELTGEQGSGKSTTARMIRALVDPSQVPVRTRPHNERDLIIAAENGWMLAFDNLSGLPDWLSDAFCRLSTGGGFGARRLYSNREEELFHAMRPVILNGIDDLTTRGDLADRAITLHLKAIEEAKRRTESDVWHAFSSDRPFILGALFDAVSTGLRRMSDVELDTLPRMADFAEWVVAAEPALPVEPGTFMRVYINNQATSMEHAVANDSVGAAIASMLGERQSWTGKTSTLLEDLKSYLPDPQSPPKDYPSTYQAMGARLRRIRPALRGVGIERNDDPRERSRDFTLRKITPSDEANEVDAVDGAGPNGAQSEPERSLLNGQQRT
jgi:hypothetical protein